MKVLFGPPSPLFDELWEIVNSEAIEEKGHLHFERTKFYWPP